MKPFSHKAPLSRYALALAIYTLVAFHVPFSPMPSGWWKAD